MSASIDNWASRLKASTGIMARKHMSLFMRWLKQNGSQFKEYSPDQLVEYQRNADNSHRYDVLDLVQSHVLSMKGRKSSKTTRYTYMRSFFLHNRAELPRDRSFRVRGDEPMVRGDLTIEEVRKIVLASDPSHQAAFLCMFQGGRGSHELLFWSKHGLNRLEKEFQNNAGIIKIDLPGRKGNENDRAFYTFIGSDALESLRKWMDNRPKDCREIFVSIDGTPFNYFSLQAYWRRKLRRLSIGPKNAGIRGRTGKNMHELRDLFRSQWAKSPAKPEVAEYCMGHVIDPLDYNKAWRDEKFYRDEYCKALPYLQILSSGKPFHQIDEEEVDLLRNEVAILKNALESRRESDDVMNHLFEDSEFRELLTKKLKELKM